MAAWPKPCRERQRQARGLLSDSMVVMMGIQSTEVGEGVSMEPYQDRHLWRKGGEASRGCAKAS